MVSIVLGWRSGHLFQELLQLVQQLFFGQIKPDCVKRHSVLL